MKQVDILRRLPGPAQPFTKIVCDEPLYQELIVLSALGFAEGHGERGATEHVWRGRLTLTGVDHLAALERRERCDG